jgi:hypothetical protein
VCQPEERPKRGLSTLIKATPLFHKKPRKGRRSL